MPLRDTLDAWLPRAAARISTLTLEPRLEHIGKVVSVGDGIAIVAGLPETRANEILLFPGDVPGMALTLDRETIGCVLLGGEAGITAGDVVHGTGSVVRTPVGDGLLGRVVDPLGRPLDGLPPIATDRFEPVERPAPSIIERDFVTEPLQTGILVIDAMFALGRGQRELIIGDRQTGKTAIALDTIINQRTTDVHCIYAAVGQKSSGTREVIEAVRRHGASERCTFVVAGADSPPGLQWIAPFAAMSIAEHFRDAGRHALVVIDDLSKHAAVHREIALLLRQPPGREAYPGDVFYLHARLLERAAKLSEERGGGSLTALPIAETQAGNLSAYIPTNLISITDGQIVLDSKLFYEGQRPAVDVGRSVSRVGGKTQAPALHEIAGRLRLDYAQFLELEAFTRFGAAVDERASRAIEHGRRIRALLEQPPKAPLPLALELAVLVALETGALDTLPPGRIGAFRAQLDGFLRRRAPEALDRLAAGTAIGEAERGVLGTVLRELAASVAGASP